MDERESKSTQCQRIINYIIKFRAITAAQAMDDLGCFRLASRIYDLKQQGYPIKSIWVHDKNRYGEKVRYKMYVLPEEWEGWKQSS